MENIDRIVKNYEYFDKADFGNQPQKHFRQL